MREEGLVGKRGNRSFLIPNGELDRAEKTRQREVGELKHEDPSRSALQAVNRRLFSSKKREGFSVASRVVLTQEDVSGTQGRVS